MALASSGTCTDGHCASNPARKKQPHFDESAIGRRGGDKYKDYGALAALRRVRVKKVSKINP